MSKERKTERLFLRLSESDRALLFALAGKRSKSALIRDLVRREAVQRGVTI